METMSKKTFVKNYRNKYRELYGEEVELGSNQQRYEALGSLIREMILKASMETNKKYNSTKEKQIYYFSMEFLLGRLLGDTLLNLGILDVCREGLKELNINLKDLEEWEQDQGLGNGGL